MVYNSQLYKIVKIDKMLCNVTYCPSQPSCLEWKKTDVMLIIIKDLYHLIHIETQTFSALTQQNTQHKVFIVLMFNDAGS